MRCHESDGIVASCEGIVKINDGKYLTHWLGMRYDPAPVENARPRFSAWGIYRWRIAKFGGAVELGFRVDYAFY
jgi:hypothetical protein